MSGSALSGSAPRPSLSWSVHRVSPGRSRSVLGRPPVGHGRSPVGHGRFMMSVPDVSPQFQSWVRHLRHAGMPLRCLWAGVPCQRPVRRPLRHAGMALRYLWAGVPCRRGPIAPFIDRLGIGSVPVCHAGMALRYLWAGVPCRRPIRRTLRHAEMALRYLWAGVPCRRPVRRPPSPRGDATEVPVDRGTMPKGALAELIEL